MPRHPKDAARKEATMQTTESDAMLEIARLQEQIKLLTIENNVLRDHITNRGAIIPTGTPVKANVNPQAGTRSVKGAGKGCSCKGNCSTKICGCVKKDLKCGPACKCNDSSCQNQDGMETAKSFTNRLLEDSVSSQRGLFSPAFIDNDEKEVQNNDYHIPSISFNSAQTLQYSTSDEEQENINIEVKPSRMRRAKTREREVKNTTENVDSKQMKKVSKRHHARKSRSASNDKRSEKEERDLEVHDLRKSASSELKDMNEDTNDSLILPETGNYLKNILSGMQPLRRNKSKETVMDNEVPVSTENIVVTTKNSKQQARTVEHNTNVQYTEKKKAQEPKEKGAVSHSIRGNDKNTLSVTQMDIDFYQNDPNFDPTKPKRQLSRTPPRPSNELSIQHPIERLSDVPLPAPIIEEVQEESTTPTELLQPHVDWAEHQAQLVACKKCHRKFHPIRIKKHEACCKEGTK